MERTVSDIMGLEGSTIRRIAILHPPRLDKDHHL